MAWATSSSIMLKCILKYEGVNEGIHIHHWRIIDLWRIYEVTQVFAKKCKEYAGPEKMFVDAEFLGVAGVAGLFVARRYKHQP